METAVNIAGVRTGSRRYWLRSGGRDRAAGDKIAWATGRRQKTIVYPTGRRQKTIVCPTGTTVCPTGSGVATSCEYLSARPLKDFHATQGCIRGRPKLYRRIDRMPGTDDKGTWRSAGSGEPAL